MQLDANTKYAALLATKKAVVGLPNEDHYPDGTRWTLEAFIRGNPQFYNCKENEKLFVALAAISDVYPMLYRWMINDKTGEWIQRTPSAKFSELDKCRFASADDVILKFENWSHEG
jgi:hypothetical protein